jgi:hypothetical protein
VIGFIAKLPDAAGDTTPWNHIEAQIRLHLEEEPLVEHLIQAELHS